MKKTNIEVSTDWLENPMLERRCFRTLLFFYDVLIFIISFLLVVFLRPSAPDNSDLFKNSELLMHFLLAGGSCFLFRFLFNVYRQVLRYGNMGALARLLAADALGGMLYQGLNMVLPLKQMTFMRAFGFFLLNYALANAYREFYYYLYHLAKRKSFWGNAAYSLLLYFGGVDARSQEVARTVMPLGLDRVRKAPGMSINEVQRITKQFLLHGEVTGIEQINRGYINRTYRVTTLSEANHEHQYILQRINTNVFPDVDSLMRNSALVTKHLEERLRLSGTRDGQTAVQRLKTTKDGKDFFRDDSGSWRMSSYIDHVFSLDLPDSPQTFYESGKAFGSFVRELADVPPEQVAYVIPNFHNTLSRYEALEAAIEADTENRVKDTVPEIEFVRSQKNWFGKISEALDQGRIPLRVCHNDCNLNNLLFDADSHLPVAIIDLDTVMPSTPLYDFGDSMRVGTNRAKDDEKDLTKVSCDLKMYEAYARGYLEATAGILTKEELELLPYAAQIITIEDGIRFLTDHLDGDTYYTIYYTGQNLDRARTQLKLAEDMQRKLPEMKAILRKIYQELGLKADLS